MIKVGDKVKLNIDVIEENGMNESEEQVERFRYILEHPEEIYEVSSTITPDSIAQIRLNHPVLEPTSFFEDELILVGGEDNI